MLSNAYFLPKFRFDTAENEPAKDLQKRIPQVNPGGKGMGPPGGMPGGPPGMGVRISSEAS